MIIVKGDGSVEEHPQGELPTYLVTLTGSDGTEWDLNHGPVTLQPGVKLFDIPTLTHWLKTSPGIAGARWTGVQVEEQDFTLPVCTRGTDWADWRATDQAFFSGLFPPGEVVVTVASPDNVERSITCRLVTPGVDSDDMDPLLTFYRDYSLGLVAPNPYWQGSRVRKVVTFGDDTELFPGPPFYINTSTQVATTTITNPGDVAAWPRYTIGGPCTSWQVGVGGSLISSSTVPTGSNHILIDSAPGVRTIVDGAGNRQYHNMDQVAFAPIPPGASVTITATMENPATSSSIIVDLIPQYWRPL